MSLTYELELEINTGFTQADTITCIAFSPTDLYIAAAIGTNVLIWDMATGKLSYISPGRGACLCLAWYGDHALLAGRADGYLTQCHVIQETRVRSNLFVVDIHCIFNPRRHSKDAGKSSGVRMVGGYPSHTLPFPQTAAS